MRRGRTWTAPVALLVGAVLGLSACTGEGADDEATTAVAAPSATPSPTVEASPSVEPTASEAPSLSPADQAAAEAEAAYVEWVSFQNATLQDPPNLLEAADKDFDAFVDEVNQYGFDAAESGLISLILQYNENGWRQSGSLDVASVDAVESELEPAEGRPYVLLNVCLQPNDLRVLTENGEEAQEFADADTESQQAGRIRVEEIQEDGFNGWYVRSLDRAEGAQC